MSYNECLRCRIVFDADTLDKCPECGSLIEDDFEDEKTELCQRADFFGMDALTEDEQALLD